MQLSDLPRSVREIAEVIGVETTMRLINQLPTCATPSNRHHAIPILYVPKRLSPDHRLVQILGWHDANRLVQHFGGEILAPANCADVYKAIRNRYIRELLALGYKPDLVADLIGMTVRNVRNIAGKVQEADNLTEGDA
jgi:hypothetical protein